MRQTENIGRIDLESPAELFLIIDPDGAPENRSVPFPRDVYQEWCRESIDGLGVRYVRADLVEKMKNSDER